MALEGSDWGIVGGVFLIILAMMVYNQMAVKRNATATRSDDRPSSGEYLSRFVVHDGDVVGEVVSRDHDDLIVKHQGVFRAVPVAQARIANDEVHIRGDMDWEAAAQKGQEWLERNRKGQHDEVSAHLTTSEQVKRPAFEAFQDRKKEADGDDEEE